MKVFADHSIEHALAGHGFGSASAAPLSLERAFTATHRAHAGSHPVARELACLRLMFPSILQPIGDADLFAGRLLYPLVSFGPEPMGLGYVCRTDAIRDILARDDFPEGDRTDIATMLAYWEGRNTVERVRRAYPPELTDTLPSDAWMSDSGAGFPLYRIAGTVLDYGKLLKLGLPGLRAELAAWRQDAGLTDESREFLTGLDGIYDLFAESLRHYAAQARALAADCGLAGRAAELTRIADACTRLTLAAPASFFECCQLAWLWALHSGTWNYGRMDDYLGPWLARDLDAGVLTSDEALRLLQSWWRLMKVYDNQYNNRVFIGGRGRGEEAAADRFALLAIEATRTVRSNQPQLSLRFYAGQNPELMDRALTALGEGCTFPMLYNDDVNISAVTRAFGVGESEAVHYTPYGCGEYVLAHRSLASPNGLVNLCKVLELALHDGWDPVARRQAGPHTGALATLTSFTALWRAYTAQVEHLIRALATHQQIEHTVAGGEAAYLFLSALYDDCITRARPLLGGGVRYLGGTLETYGNTNAADALTALNELVFCRRCLPLAEVVEACDADFHDERHEAVRRLLASAPKFGNDDPVADGMAARVHEHVCRFTRAEAGRVGLHHYLVVIINNSANVILGRATAASADGRRAGSALANANNPAPGADRLGVTAFLNSLCRLDPALHAGSVQNMKFSRELFTRNRTKLEALLAGYWAKGGSQAMLSVVSRDDLAAALIEPEKWGHLMVRVGGSARDSSICRAMCRRRFSSARCTNECSRLRHRR